MSAPASGLDPAPPVFVLGVDHSGTTILYRMLAHHPDLVWLSQFSLRGGEIPGRRPRQGAGLRDSLMRRVPHPWTKEDSGLVRRLVPHPGEEPEVWRYLLEDEGASAERLRATLAAFSARHGNRRLLAKRPAFTRHLPLLREAFPTAAFVHIVRDGRAVALSLRGKELKRRPDLDPGGALEHSARFWVETLERIAATPGLEPIGLRYEDFCTDVHAGLRSVLEAAGLDPARFPFGRVPEQLEVSNSRWTADADPGELERIIAIEAELLRRHGYAAGM